MINHPIIGDADHCTVCYVSTCQTAAWCSPCSTWQISYRIPGGDDDDDDDVSDGDDDDDGDVSDGDDGDVSDGDLLRRS